MLKWIRDFLNRRRARIKLRGPYQKEFCREGVLAPNTVHLFIIFTDDLPKQFCTIYPYNYARGRSRNIATIRIHRRWQKKRMQEATNRVDEWVKTWGVQINQKTNQKKKYNHYTLLPVHQNRELYTDS